MQRVFGTILLLVVVAAVIWRLPTNGWPSLLWLATQLGITFIRAPYSKRTSENVSMKQSAQGTERLLLGLVAVLGGPLPIAHLAFGIFSFANYSVPVWASAAGGVALVFALWLFWRSHADLGDNWSVTTELREGHNLTTRGVYARIRHPMYLAIFLLFGLQPLFLQNWIAGWSGLAAFTLMYFVRVPYEEAMMRKEFGEDYDAYCARSGRLVPKLS